MIRIKKGFNAFVFVCIVLLFLSLSSKAQGDALFFERFKTDTNKNVQEKLYVHTDKDFYVAGEIIWLKIYAVDCWSQKPIDISRVAYVEIIDKNNKPISQVKIEIKNGTGSGSIYLPLSLNSSNYVFRAYTNWMKNFEADHFFHKIITVINPLKALVDTSTKITSIYNVNFFPEGGNLVKEVESKVAFKLTDGKGKGIAGKGIVINNKKDTVTRFETLKFGMGTFSFVPHNGDTYQAIIQFADGAIRSKNMPDSYDSGYVMALTYPDENHINISVYSNNLQRHTVFLIGQSQKNLTITNKAILNNGVAQFSIDKQNIAEGITQFTVFNDERKPVCERLYFKKPSGKKHIEISSEKILYRSRQKVNVVIKPIEIEQTNLLYNLSLAVYRLDSLQTKSETDIYNYLQLTSALSGIVESPDYYFSNNNPDSVLAIDNLMLVHGCRKFQWDSLSKAGKNLKYPLEYAYHIITGKVIDTRTGNPAANIQTYLSVPNSKFKLYASQSDSNGIVQFKVKDYFGPGEVIAQTNIERDSFYKVIILSPYFETYSVDNIENLHLSKSNWKILEEYSIAMQARNIYNADSLEKFFAPKVYDTLIFYGTGTHSYLLDDYKRFTTMEEVLREYVREINVVMRGGKLYLRMYNEDIRNIYEDNVLVLVNGIPLFNKNKIFSYDPLKFRKLDVISKNYVYGASVFSGLANFSTYQNNLDDLELDPSWTTIEYEGLQMQREFYSPVYENPEQLGSRIPDYRSTLFWSPDIMVTSKSEGVFNFYTSDQKGKYLMVLQGINSDGALVSEKFIFEVQ